MFGTEAFIRVYFWLDNWMIDFFFIPKSSLDKKIIINLTIFGLVMAVMNFFEVSIWLIFIYTSIEWSWELYKENFDLCFSLE